MKAAGVMEAEATMEVMEAAMTKNLSTEEIREW
jgi:hypothetical protein